MTCVFFFLMRGRPPRSTLFPYTTLSRSVSDHDVALLGPQDVERLGAVGGDAPFAARLKERHPEGEALACRDGDLVGDRKSTRLNSSHANISYAVFCLKKKKYRTEPYNFM